MAGIGRCLLIGIAALATLTPTAGAMERVEVTLTLSTNLWALNGDTVLQPAVPEAQKLDVPALVVNDLLSVTPSAARVTRISPFEAGFIDGPPLSFSRTDGGATLLLANPTRRFVPFTARFEVEVRNQQGIALGCAPWTAEVPIDLTSRICLDEELAEGCVFEAVIDVPGALGDPRLGTRSFSASIENLRVPIEGTARPARFTTGRVTVMERIITRRLDDDPFGIPTGYKTFTFTSTGTATSRKLALVSPVVIHALIGDGLNRAPIPIIGFAVASTTGVAYGTGADCQVSEPRLLLLGLVAALTLASVGRWRV